MLFRDVVRPFQLWNIFPMLQRSPSCTMALPMEKPNDNIIAMHEATGVDSRWDDRIDKGSTERECRSLLSFNTPLSNNSSWGSDGNRHVHFKSIRIKQYERILGDHPSCSAGASIGYVARTSVVCSLKSIDCIILTCCIHFSQYQNWLDHTARRDG